MNRLPALGILVLLCACELNPEARIPIAATNALTRQYARQKLQAYVAGNDCLVLLIRAKGTLDAAAVEAIHYGNGESGAYNGGLQQFAEDQKFRAVAYKDANGGLWTYGSITRSEAQTMPLCR